jgi:hypothetical protein
MATTPHTSSPAPKGLSVDEELQYYKTQYEQMEADLQDFQASSRELELELERDIEASELRERQLKEKVDNFSFEVEEWKVCDVPVDCTWAQRLTVTGKAQAGKGRGQRRPKHTSERDHHIARRQSDAHT